MLLHFLSCIEICELGSFLGIVESCLLVFSTSRSNSIFVLVHLVSFFF